MGHLNSSLVPTVGRLRILLFFVFLSAKAPGVCPEVGWGGGVAGSGGMGTAGGDCCMLYRVARVLL